MSTSSSSASAARHVPGVPLVLSFGEAAVRALQAGRPERPATEAASDAMALAARLHPDDRNHFLHTVDWIAAAGSETARSLVRLARFDGVFVSLVASIGPTGPDGVAVRLDLDDAAAARRAEAQIRQVVEGARQAAVVLIGTKYVFTNTALARLLGYASLAELRATGGSVDHIHPDDRAMVLGRALARAAGEDAPDSYEYRAIRVDGSVRWVECITSPVTWNGQRATLAWLLDITDRKRTEEALRQSEKLFETIFKSSPAMLVLSRLDDGRLIDVNDGFLCTLGYERAALIGRTVQEIGLFVDADVPRRVRASLDAPAAEREIVVAVRAASGGQRDIAISAQVVHFADRDLLLAVGRDVTERRRELEELRESKNAAELANRTKSEFLANMSHELRTPLNAIIGFSEVIKRELFGPVGTPRYADYATDIWNSGTHLLQIINDLLDLSKLDAGKQELHEIEVTLPAAVEDSLRLVGERAGSAGVEIVCELAGNLPRLCADARLLKQMLLNLLTNAVKFTPRGGRITIRVAVDHDDRITFAVADTGIGMSAEEIEIALTPFGQVDNTYTRRQQGTGLGLPLVRALAELHGGRLVIESAPGVGTTATVSFPPHRTVRFSGTTLV